MEQLAKALDRGLEWLTKAAGIIAGLCILITAFIIVYEIVMRGVFHAPTEWVLEVSVYLILIAGFLGLALTFSADAHVKVDLFVARLSPRTRSAVDILTAMLGVAFCIVFIVESVEMVKTSFVFDRTSPSTLRVPLFLPQLALVVGGGLLLLQFIRKICVDAYFLLRGKQIKQAGKRG